MNKGTTVAFDNTGKVWKTRYSFVPTRYAYLDKKLLSCQGYRGVAYDNSALVWRHDEKNVGINKFYGEQFRSSLKSSFNKDLSANKLYKSLSLEGTTNLKGGVNRFLANSTTQKSHLRDASVGKLKEKGGILYADLGRGAKNSSSNVGVVGTIKGATALFSSPSDADKYGYSYDPNLIKLDVDFISSNFTSSSDFKILIGLDSPGRVSLQGQLAQVGGRSYDDISSELTSAGGVAKGKDFLILKGLGAVTEVNLLGDLDDSGQIGSGDLINLLSAYGGDGAADFDNDGVVTAADLLIFLTQFGQSSVVGTEGTLIILNAIIETAAANGETPFAFIATPNKINGRDPKGQYADLFLNLGVYGSEDFELDVLNLNYEHTRLDHSS